MAHLPTALLALGRLETERCDISFARRDACLVPAHSHPTTNYGVITAGCLWLTQNGEEKAYRCGDWFHVPANELHAERFEEATSVIVFWLQQE